MQAPFLLPGMFQDKTAMLVIVAPLYIPLVRALEIDLICYGILYMITCQIAYIPPAFGYNQLLMRALAPEHVSLIDIYSSIVPLVGILISGAWIGHFFANAGRWAEVPDRLKMLMKV